jgi:peptidoglycan hydrolase-like protein with peptidoglycan-binding domain
LQRATTGLIFAKNNYDGKLRDFFSKFSTASLPDIDIRAAQVYLTFRGFDPNGIDGIMGPGTRSALIEFQKNAQLPETGLPDAATLAKLAPS